MYMKKRTAILAISSLLLAIGIGGTAILFAPSAEQGVVRSSGTALVGGPFQMTNQDGKRVSEKDFLGKHTIYYFGYTFCPDVCPGELQVISAALTDIEGAADKFNLVFVTIDAERDTPAVMKEYVANFWPGTTGLTGSAEDVARIAKAFRVYFAKAAGPDTNTDSYLMDHSSIAYLMDQKGAFVQHFPYGTSADDIGKALKVATSN